MKQLDATINSFSLSFYTPDEIRKLAVKEITSSISIEREFCKGAVEGLYDSSLGPLSDKESCRNCNLSYMDCNGHFGRIEFPRVVYNPMLFSNLDKFLRGTCLYCHKICYGQGMSEILHELSPKSDNDLSLKKLNDVNMYKSMSRSEKEKLAVKIMSQQRARLCTFCTKKSLIIKKSRKCEILVHISTKVFRNNDEPEAKRMRFDDSSHLKEKCRYKSSYSADELYGNFKDEEIAIYPEIIREHLRFLWVNEELNMQLIFPFLKNGNFEYPTDVFFMENMLINPPMNRLPAIMNGDQMSEGPETTNMRNVIRATIAAKEIIKMTESRTAAQNYQNIRESILELQKRVNTCFDSNMHRELSDSQPGLRQKIDKKVGLFRQNIMGKRVNFACRSVISPDPTIGLDEIGVPVRFLMKLEFPQPLFEQNKEFLKQCVINGPDVYPGAVSYIIEDGNPSMINRNRESIAEYLESMYQKGVTIIVNRHAMSGDVLIMNRQPTLHRPSMQAHVIRAIMDPNAKTLRMHYSNCKAYNADFDGDEMNGHYPQSIPAQVEAKQLVNVCHQHSTPKDGSPLSGLIQDHVIAGTRMCMQSCLLERREYLDLVIYGLQNNYTPPLIQLKPAVGRYYTGRQVLSTVIMNSIPKNLKLPNISCSEPKKRSLWKVSAGQLTDVELTIINGYICTGIFDKAHIGPSQKGLCIDLRELYGPNIALQVLTSLSRVLNRYLIYTGFSTGIKDGLLDKDGEEVRRNNLRKLKCVGLTSIAKTFKIPQENIDLQNITDLMERAQFDKSDEFKTKMAEIDINFKMLSTNLVNTLVTTCNKHLREEFPYNNLSLMSQTGAKGGESNITKIASLVGAIEIEGKRCPLTIGGKTLPSFKKYDVDPASRGFCKSCFTKGLSPQEVFFESAAGRDGLVDTAVKTSSSGYLQRSIIKILEDITVRFDGTVRDNMENIIQTKYGYDGLDVVNAKSISSPDPMDVIVRNIPLMKTKYLGNRSDTMSGVLDKSREKYISAIVDKFAKEEVPISASDEKDLRKIIAAKTIIAACSPGEAVGLLAAQSIGEPSTQMTLNTFHNAGQSEMNVTLGIPRMREILMSGSEKINTPSMAVPILNTEYAKKNIAFVLQKFNRLHLKDVIKLPLKLQVSDYYEITFSFKKKSSYKHITNLERNEIVTLIENTFFRALAKRLKKDMENNKIEITDVADKEFSSIENSKIGDDENVEEPAVEEKEENAEDKCEDNGEISDLSDLDEIDSDKDEVEEEAVELEESADENGDDIENEEDIFQEKSDMNFNNNNKRVVQMCSAFHDYKVHHDKEPKWLKLTIRMKDCKVDLKSLLLNLFETTVISSINGVDKALVIKKDNSFATEGYNNMELFKYDLVFNLNKFYSNNIIKMSKLYGIEAAISCLEKEVMTVFKSYSIEVSSRHLRLIADFLTFSGEVGAFNRHSIKNHSSQLQRASFETALTVLNEMIIHGDTDFIKSPSANIMLGQPVANMGTNAIDLFLQ